MKKMLSERQIKVQIIFNTAPLRFRTPLPQDIAMVLRQKIPKQTEAKNPIMPARALNALAERLPINGSDGGEKLGCDVSRISAKDYGQGNKNRHCRKKSYELIHKLSTS